MQTHHYHLPPEWHPQSAVQLAWPPADSDWAPWLAQVEAVYIELIGTICRYQQVLLVLNDQERQSEIRTRLIKAGVPIESVYIWCQPTNDTWARDFGPLTVLDKGKPLILDWAFNGWGGKFPSRLDNQVTEALHRRRAYGGCHHLALEFILEGGAIEVDGQGTLMTTSHCLEAPGRNFDMERRDYEGLFRRFFGCDHVLWLEHGHLAGDDTDGHIDTLARFVDHRTIVHISCDDPNDEHYDEMQAMAEDLAAFRDPQGRPYRLLPLPWPQAIYNDDGERLPATYANFLIINDAVLMPGYNDPADAVAKQVLEQAFPTRDVITIDCRPIIEQFGSLHCLTMQLPQEIQLTPAIR